MAGNVLFGRGWFVWVGGLLVGAVLGGAAAPPKPPEKPPLKAEKAPSQNGAAEKTPAEKAPSEKAIKKQAALQELWRKIYTRPEQLAQLTNPTICILDIQHPDRIYEQLNSLPKPMEQFYACRFRARVAEISRLDTIVVHATEVQAEDLDRPQIKALLIGGRSKSLPRKIDEQFYSFLRQTNIPILGICGGAQLIARAYGGKVDRMRKLRPGETDPNPKYHPGWFKEWGLTPVQLLKPDPLFANLPEKPIFREFHAFQILQPPKEFELLASTEECRVQAMKHRDRLVYAVQFHPERYDAQHADGRQVLANFFRLALGQSLATPRAEQQKAIPCQKRND